MSFSASAHVRVARPDEWIDAIHDRLHSFGATTERYGALYQFRYDFGRGEIDVSKDGYRLTATSDSEDGLARLLELLAMAVELHARPDQPIVRWTGDLSQQRQLLQFREMRVVEARSLTPRMRRVTLTGSDLGRFEGFGGIHARLLFPRTGTRWPTLGANGLPVWPDEPLRPDVRVYTIRHIDAAAGRMDVDFVLHGEFGIGGPWAERAQAGDVVGVLGPVGRPIRLRDRLLMGADETGLPAVSRLVEELPSHAVGTAVIELEDEEERLPIGAPPGFTIHWLYRKGGPSRLVEVVLEKEWSSDSDSFGWFAAEHEQAAHVRHRWREILGLSRDRTLVAGYWRRGERGAMAQI